LDGWV